MTQPDEPTKLFDALQWHEIELPRAVRCVHCGEVARLEDVGSDDYQITHCYQCEACGGWVEWEIVNDDGDIRHSILFFREDLQADATHQMEMRGWPHAWIPDGVNVPEKGQVK